VALVETHILRRRDAGPHLGFAVFDEISGLLKNKFGGRPHWGKNFARDFVGVRERYPHFDRFEAVRVSSAFFLLLVFPFIYIFET
jgi:hypothetical protein